jgi:hypothetical protein
MSYQNLPPDIKRKIAYTVEPAESLELCKTVKCDWKRLLDLNYDFVTQGFAIGSNSQEKFEYLAQKVSKNVGVDNPKIIFVHFNGIPFGKKRFFERNYDYLENESPEFKAEEIETEQNYLKLEREAIIRQIQESSAVEWLKEDDYNVWISVINPDDLPKEFPVKTSESKTVLRDNTVFDFPLERKEEIETYTEGILYPNDSKFTDEDITQFLNTVIESLEIEDFDPEDLDPEEAFNEYIQEFANEGGLYNTTDSWNVFQGMLSGFPRNQAEIFAKVLKSKNPYKSLND